MTWFHGRQLKVSWPQLSRFCRAMRCITRPMPSCGVCVSVTFVSCVKTNKDIFDIFLPSGSHTILVFHTKRDGDIPTGTPLTGASNTGGVSRNRNSEPICLLLTLQQARCCKHGRRWTTAIISQVVTLISLVVFCGYSTTKRHARWSRRLRGSSARERPSALSHYTQSR